ncbi:MAG: hypothetical protein ACYC1L_13235 [Alphaproteobacteria bacterium]
MSRISDRISKLEAAAPAMRDVLIWCEDGETTEQAIARRIEARPDQANARFLIFTWGKPEGANHDAA